MFTSASRTSWRVLISLVLMAELKPYWILFWNTCSFTLKLRKFIWEEKKNQQQTQKQVPEEGVQWCIPALFLKIPFDMFWRNIDWSVLPRNSSCNLLKISSFLGTMLDSSQIFGFIPNLLPISSLIKPLPSLLSLQTEKWDANKKMWLIKQFSAYFS